MTTYIERQSDASIPAPTHWIIGCSSTDMSIAASDLDASRVSRTRPTADATPAVLFGGVYYLLDEER